MKHLLIAAIRLYQRCLSPHKGYGCAYRLHTGRGSCSCLGLRAVRRYGVWQGLAVLHRRLFLCGVAYRRYGRFRPRFAPAQQGFCDIPCDLDLPCDGPGGEPAGSLFRCLSPIGDLLDAGASCDSPSRSRKSADTRAEASVHIPPPRRRSQT